MSDGGISVGAAIRVLLAAKGWRQRDLAAVLGHSEPYVSDVLNGKRKISSGMAMRLAAAFDGTTPDEWYRFRVAADMADGLVVRPHKGALVPLKTCPVHNSPWRDHSRCGEERS